MSISVWDGISTQDAFFTSMRPWQPIIHLEDANSRKKVSENTIAAFKQKYGWKSRRTWPTTREMAEACGLKTLYDFVYSATSKLVHFNPHVLLRNGCTMESVDKEALAEFHDPEKALAASVAFSTKSFSRYYGKFNSIYGVYLFVLFCQTFEVSLSLNEKVKKTIRQLAALEKAELRWPELVTFEELNLLPPRTHVLQYALRGKILTEELEDFDEFIEGSGQETET